MKEFCTLPLVGAKQVDTDEETLAKENWHLSRR